ncbi:hypothetical protein [Polyangium aurulentum]|uniref:hypothetical protein n=1 Tax=Polyangium aurulentum TaxID=2567896 RepID=UPI0010AEC2A6|nr:hypothetical protein [Polyangium aurulentum]UQA61195.1 hypothetical protein E8A73_012230 [Polyangium aurulentum]
MALIRTNRPFLDALRPTRGSLRVVAWRWAFALLTSLPGVLMAVVGVSREAARRPYYTEVRGPMPGYHFARILEESTGILGPAVLVSVLLALIADQFLTAGAISLAHPARPEEDRRGVLSTIAQEGLAHLYPFVRTALMGGLLFVLGAGVLVRISSRLGMASERAGNSMLTTAVLLPLSTALLTLLWFSAVGAWVLWCRLITVADGRRTVRRTGLLALAVWRRRPVRALVLPVLLTLAAALLPGAIPIAWRLSAPASGGGVLAWAVAWLAALFAQAFVWYWMIRAGRLIYASPDLDALRSSPDTPLGLLVRLRRLGRKDRPARAEAPSAPASS